jgi:biopolymer transport protein ExbD
MSASLSGSDLPLGRSLLLPRRRRLQPYLDLTAMIDTVFNLLIFFAVTTTFVGARTALPMRLPAANTAQPVSERIVVTLLPGQPVQINDQVVVQQQIGAEAMRAADGDTDAQVVVVADEKVPYSQLVGALDELRSVGFHRIALAASPKRTAEPQHFR